MDNIQIPKELRDVWQDGWEIKASFQESLRGTSNVKILANRAGLVTLAKLLLFISTNKVHDNYHFHLDKVSGINIDSDVGLILQKREEIDK